MLQISGVGGRSRDEARTFHEGQSANSFGQSPNHVPIPPRDAHRQFGDLPEWNLADLYPGMDSAELVADLARAAKDAVAFEAAWKGKLADEAGRGADGRLGEAIEAFDALEDLTGRIGSYAGLLYAGDTSDPARAKLYGDVQQKLTDIGSHLLFFPLELNRIDDALIERALEASPRLGRYRPWIVDLRMDRPYQLEGPHRAAVPQISRADGAQRLERLFRTRP